ncbi:hypothetical protein BZG36_03090 [Bifiguratus adelaidae]|uniref:EF-hand domain-containing protein n=1 Tax=Bifiguratus adelaidae TaxID=1938954 RepID=A0A261XYW6_9FUNG|nr:hypothetical protein BZG36_03090 [Bifiguratus adelaidae]
MSTAPVNEQSALLYEDIPLRREYPQPPMEQSTTPSAHSNASPPPEYQNRQENDPNDAYYEEEVYKKEKRRSFLYRGIVYLKNLSMITRVVFVYIIPVWIVLAIPIVLGFVLFPKALIGGVPLGWWGVYFAIFCTAFFGARIPMHYVPNIIQWFFGTLDIQTKTYMDYARYTQTYLAYVVFAVIANVAYYPIVVVHNNQGGRYQSYDQIIQKLLGIMLIGSVIWAVEKLLLQALALTFHKKQYRDRIETSKFHMAILTRLNQTSEKILHYRAQQTVSSSGLSTPMAVMATQGAKNLLWTARMLAGKAASTIGNIAAEVTGNSLEDDADILNFIFSTADARRLAQHIYRAYVPKSRQYLLLSDFLPAFDNDEEYTEQVFAAFDKDGSRDLTKEELTIAVVEMYKDRKSIVASMRDLDSAVGKLDSILMAIMFVILILVIVAFFDVNFGSYVAAVGSTVLSISFVISPTAQQIMTDILFLFVSHPFDVGDRVDIDAESYTVKEMGLLNTIFDRSDGKEVYFPNYILATKPILNIRRSGIMGEAVSLSINMDTSFEQIEQLRLKMNAFLETEPKEFFPTTDITIADFEDLQLMKISIAIPHKSNWQDIGKAAQRRNKFMCVLKSAIAELGIQYQPKTLRYRKMTEDTVQPALISTPTQPASGERDSSNGEGTVEGTITVTEPPKYTDLGVKSDALDFVQDAMDDRRNQRLESIAEDEAITSDRDYLSPLSNIRSRSQSIRRSNSRSRSINRSIGRRSNDTTRSRGKASDHGATYEMMPTIESGNLARNSSLRYHPSYRAGSGQSGSRNLGEGAGSRSLSNDVGSPSSGDYFSSQMAVQTQQQQAVSNAQMYQDMSNNM